MCEPRNRDNGASDLWTLTAYTQVDIGCAKAIFLPKMMLDLLWFHFHDVWNKAYIYILKHNFHDFVYLLTLFSIHRAAK